MRFFVCAFALAMALIMAIQANWNYQKLIAPPPFDWARLVALIVHLIGFAITATLGINLAASP